MQKAQRQSQTVSPALLKVDVLRPREPTRQDNFLCTTYTHIVTLLDSLDCPQGLSNTLGLIGKLKQELCTDGITAKRRTDCASRLGNRTGTSLNHKVIQIVPLHELQDIAPKCHLAIPQRLDLCLK